MTFERAFFNAAFNENISEWIVGKGKTFQGRFNKAVNFDKAIGANGTRKVPQI